MASIVKRVHSYSTANRVMFTISHSKATGIHLFLAVLAVAGVSYSDFNNSPLVYRISAAAFASIVVAGLTLQRPSRRRWEFERNSKELENFFALWYSALGDLSIYCDDLDWVGDTVFVRLLGKCRKHQLTLYLRECGTRANELRIAGAVIHQIPTSAVSTHKFSILRDDNFESMICRSKYLESSNAKGERVEFIYATSTHDPHLIAFAKDVLKACPRTI